jgi:hypothetical protein
MAPVYAFHMVKRSKRPDTLARHSYRIMTVMNKAFETRQANLEEQIRRRLEAWYPRAG